MTFHTRNMQRPMTVDMDARTVEATVSTGADVPRGGFIERLDLRGADLSRLIGAPVLDAHRTASTRDQLGVVTAAELRPQGLWAQFRMRDNDAARAVLRDVKDGTLTGVSIGYTIEETREERDGQRRIRIATRWTPLEVSIVPVPADPGAHFRAGETHMTTTHPAETTADPAAVQTRAAVNAEIRELADTFGLARSWADGLIDRQATADEARADAVAAVRRRNAETPTRSTRAQIGTDHTDPTVVASRAGEALYARTHPEHTLSPEARQWAGMTMPDLARDARNGPVFRRWACMGNR